ncbi:hypothetical protein [Ancylobacter amanitiformis]|uniref:Secreted protein n=1 Tax=Ancylobacter amanitiformis TaxID=217069 RepID=A0ABU0LWU2_9HYPH|nr:hypothetical protein [Ancylobacter amanitiformis]MDQ0513199.1 hypothetical protein [Ancylobacter amanitiformis]
MYQLVLYVCLLANLEICREERTPTEARLPMECMSAAMEWAVAHPALQLRRWRCGRTEREALRNSPDRELGS